MSVTDPKKGLLRKLKARKAKHGFEGCSATKDPERLRLYANIFEAVQWIDTKAIIEQLSNGGAPTYFKFYTENDQLAEELEKYC